MLRWTLTLAMLGASTWIACGLDKTSRTEQAAQTFLDAPIIGSDGSVVVVPDATVGGSDGGVVGDAGATADAGTGSDGGVVGDAGTGDAGIGGDGGIGNDGGGGDATISDSGNTGDDSGLGQDAHRGNSETFDRTNFYTCASCGTGVDPTLMVVLAVGVVLVLRRRRH